MKCFECGKGCVTKYIREPPLHGKIIAVSKICEHCGWESYPTKLPEPIR